MQCDMDRRSALRAMALVPAGLAMGAASAAPDFGLAKLVTGGPPGSVMDVLARPLAQQLQGHYARALVVENKPGASGQISMAAVKAAPPDGMTALLCPLGFLFLYPHTYKRLPYDPGADFIPVCGIAGFDLAFAIGPAVPPGVKSLSEFFAWCKEAPDKRANFGSPASGSEPHFVGALAGRGAGVALTHIPYKGPSPAVMDLIGGQVPAVASTLTDFVPHLKSGKCRILATTGEVRSRFTPTVPTFEELGFRDIVVRDSFAMLVPAHTPARLVERLGLLLKEALSAPRVLQVLEDSALEPRWTSPQEVLVSVKSETRRWGDIVRKLNFTAES